jgi:hypothetical protein
VQQHDERLPRLLEPGLDALSAACANELAAFSTPGSTSLLVGAEVPIAAPGRSLLAAIAGAPFATVSLRLILMVTTSAEPFAAMTMKLSVAV